MLLASPLRPGAIVLGKLVAALAHLAVLIFSSLPIVMLCLPLGGVSFYEVLAAYLGLLVSVVTFGMISIACSSYFKRTAASLVVSYLLILPLALTGVLLWFWLSNVGRVRLLLTVTLLPGVGAAICVALFANTCVRLLHPPDMGSEAKEVVDLEQEAKEAVGLVIQPHQFPDRLFAPAKRDALLPDGCQSGLRQGGAQRDLQPGHADAAAGDPGQHGAGDSADGRLPVHQAGVRALVHQLRDPVQHAGGAGVLGGQRDQRTGTADAGPAADDADQSVADPVGQTAGRAARIQRADHVPAVARAAGVRDGSSYWTNMPAVAGYLVIVLLTCLTTAGIALFCSVLFHKTSTSLMTTYLVIVVLFCAPLAARFFAERFSRTTATPYVVQAGLTSPFAATFALPLDVEIAGEVGRDRSWGTCHYWSATAFLPSA